MPSFLKLFAPKNRGILIDIVVCITQLFLLRMIVIRLDALVSQAEDDGYAKIVVGSFFLVLCFLQPIGVILKRWNQRRFDAAQEYEYGQGCRQAWLLLSRFTTPTDLNGNWFSDRGF